MNVSCKRMMGEIEEYEISDLQSSHNSYALGYNEVEMVLEKPT